MCGPPNPENYRKRLESGIKDESEEALIFMCNTCDCIFKEQKNEKCNI